jgi:uncharacterized membrane protein HdeD (DUF308 family)
LTEVPDRSKNDEAIEPADRVADHGHSPARDTASAIVTVTARSRHLKSAAMLVIAAGILSMANGLAAMFTGGEVYAVDLTISVGTYCGALVLLLGIGGILSGVVALKMRRLSPALAGAILGIAGGGLMGFWFGLAAIVLLTLSHEDF